MSKATSTGITGALPDYWERATALPFKKIHILESRNSPTQFLSAVEKATVKVSVDPLDDLATEHSLLGEAVVRLALFEERGLLRYMSGQYLAGQLQGAFWPAHPSRLARRGWSLLAALDAADLGVQVHISGEPLDHDGRFRRMRLSARLDEIAAGQGRLPYWPDNAG